MSRLSYLLKRLVMSGLVVLFGTSVTFALLRLGPIDPARAVIGKQGDREAYLEVRQQLGLDEPLWQQYLDFMVSLFTFDLGQSWVINPGVDAFPLILQYAPRTIWLGFWAVLIAIFVGIPLGFYAGFHPNTWGDYLASFGGIVWRAMPNFWLAVIVVAVLSKSTDILFGFDWKTWLVYTPKIVTPPDLSNLHEPRNLLAAIKRIAPAAIVLGSASMGNEMRIGRTAVLETANSNYVEAAKARGIPRRSLVWKHVFRNALIPLVPVVTGEAFILIGGSVLVETVFAINGLGYLFVQATMAGDLPLVGSLMFVFIVLIVLVNVLQDVLYTLIDPRVGYEAGGAR